MEANRGTRRCWRCGTLHSRSHAWCAGCHAAYMRDWRPKHRDLSPEQRKRANARSKAHTYLARGKLQRQPCADCGSAEAQMHHEDYSRPLDVVWLCREHHLKRHARLGSCSSTR